jgi:UDPglucose 6-dehydrogenase
VLRGKKICVWGLAFKPNTDDIRYAPALKVVSELLEEGATVQAYDPQAMANTRQELEAVVYCRDPYEAARGADAIVLLTEWQQFRNLDWTRLRQLVERPLIADGRNALSCDEVISHGFQYVGIGGISGMPELAGSMAS